MGQSKSKQKAKDLEEKQRIETEERQAMRDRWTRAVEERQRIESEERQRREAKEAKERREAKERKIRKAKERQMRKRMRSPSPRKVKEPAEVRNDVKSSVEHEQCGICLDNKKCIAFNCGHVCVCHSCSLETKKCPLCRRNITERKVVYI